MLGNSVAYCSTAAIGASSIFAGRTATPKLMMVIDAFASPGKIMQIGPSIALCFIAHILMQSICSCVSAGESALAACPQASAER